MRTAGSVGFRSVRVGSFCGMSRLQLMRLQDGRIIESPDNDRNRLHPDSPCGRHSWRFPAPVVPGVGMDEGAKMSGYRFLSLAKRSLLCLFLASLVGVSIQGYLLIQEARETLVYGRQQIDAVTQEARDSLREWKTYTAELRAQANDPQIRRGIGLLLRSGDDLARTIKKANVVLETLNDAIRDTSAAINGRTLPGLDLAISRTADQIHDSTLPEIARTLQAATSATESARDAIKDTSVEINKSVITFQKSIESINIRINDSRIDSIVSNIESATNNGNKTLQHIEKKTSQLVKPIHWFWRGLKSGIVIIGRIFVP